jgi:hypothetical protein
MGNTNSGDHLCKNLYRDGKKTVETDLSVELFVNNLCTAA